MKPTENQQPTTDIPEQNLEQDIPPTDKTTEDPIPDTDKTAEQPADWQDRYMRLSAEFDNFRKRTIKEKIELIESGGEKAVKAFLEVADDLERALKQLPESTERQGIELIYKKFMDTLRAQNVVPIEALDKPLDVDFHDAIAKFPTGNPEKAGIVIDVVQTGYMIGNKVLRHAKVVVGE